MTTTTPERSSAGTRVLEARVPGMWKCVVLGLGWWWGSKQMQFEWVGGVSPSPFQEMGGCSKRRTRGRPGTRNKSPQPRRWGSSRAMWLWCTTQRSDLLDQRGVNSFSVSLCPSETMKQMLGLGLQLQLARVRIEYYRLRGFKYFNAVDSSLADVDVELGF